MEKDKTPWVPPVVVVSDDEGEYRAEQTVGERAIALLIQQLEIAATKDQKSQAQKAGWEKLLEWQAEQDSGL